MGGIDCSHSRHVTENDFVGCDAYDRAIVFEEFVNRLTPSEANNVDVEPYV